MTLHSGRELSHYRLIDKIGQGGMGVVWKAEDTVLGRTVAIKVLPPDASRDDRRRELFLQEAKLASSLSDAHVVHVNELGRDGDLDFIVMEFIEGKPLGKILHGRPLPPDKVAELGLQVATALSKAHKKGLIHRDIKPANLLVTPDGDVKVVDFGLAALFEPTLSSADPDDETVPEGSWRTEGSVPDPPAGARRREIAGTLPYMAPEQVRRETLDTRSDVFSLGVVLYEMTTGRRPFEAADTAGLMKEIVKGRPTPVHEMVPKVPLELARIVHKALSSKKADRYQTMEDLAVDLRRLGKELESGSSPSYESVQATMAPSRRRVVLIVAGAVVALAVGLTGWQRGWWAPAPPLDEKTILVLPLEVRGQDEGADYVGRAFAEALVIELAQSKDLTVLPVPKDDVENDPVTLAHTSEAGSVVTGALTRNAEHVSVSLNMIDSSVNRIVWGMVLDDPQGNLPSLVSKMTWSIQDRFGAERQKLYGTPAELLLQSPRADTPEALAYFGAVARYDLRGQSAAVEQLLSSFPEDFDVRAAHLWSRLETWWEFPSAENKEALRAAQEQLDRLDPANPYTQYAAAYQERETDPETSNSMFTSLLDGNDLTERLRAAIIQQRGTAKVVLGDYEDGLEDIRASIRLNPIRSSAYEALARALSSAGRHAESEIPARQCVAMSPVYGAGWQRLGFSLERQGKIEEAIPAHEKACSLSEAQSGCASFVIVLEKNGRHGEAREWAERTAGLTDSIYGAYNLACYHALAGERNTALRWLRRAVELGLSSFYATNDPDLDSLRGDPEFESIMSAIKLRLAGTKQVR